MAVVVWRTEEAGTARNMNEASVPVQLPFLVLSDYEI